MKEKMNPQMSRYCSLILLFLILGIIPIEAISQSEKEIKMSKYTMFVDNSNAISVKTRGSDILFKLGKLCLSPTPEISPINCKYEIVNKDGCKAFRARYKLSSDIFNSVEMSGIFIARPYGIEVSYDISGIPENYIKSWNDSKFQFELAKGFDECPISKLGLWQRNKNGGLPIEEADSKILAFKRKNEMVYLAFDKDNQIYEERLHDGFSYTVLSKKGEGEYATHFSVLVGLPSWPVEAVNACWKGRPFSLKLETDKVYNWWKEATDSMGLKATVVNTTNKVRKIVLKYWVRNFAGDLLVNKSEHILLKAGEILLNDIYFKPTNVRDIFFMEAFIEDEKGVELTFSRTNLSLLPPHNFNSTYENSFMGLSAYWSIPDFKNMKLLIERMGVRWLRNGDASEFNGIQCMFHNNIDWNKDYTDDEQHKFIIKSMNDMLDHGNYIWEFGNEVNMANPGGIALAGNGIGKAFFAKKYVAWLKAIKKIQSQDPKYKNIKIISCGVAGMDKLFLDSVYALGGWNLLDGLALHPGRGNFTPDYPVYKPWEDWAGEVIAHENNYEDFYLSNSRKKNDIDIKSDDSYWNFYGSVRMAKKFIENHGGNKELYLTEVYALDWPNNWWNDKPREATENVLLTYALSAAEGVRTALYYQLFNSVWYDILGINAENREYYFGLINRDLSFKPLLMAYCTAAEVLDGAIFRGWIKFDELRNKNSRGMLFDTPKGEMAILWDRTEGYILTQKSDNYISSEPWVENWKTKVAIDIPVTRGKLAILNSIGQEKDIVTKENNVELNLTGAPVIVYGIDPSRIELH